MNERLELLKRRNVRDWAIFGAIYVLASVIYTTGSWIVYLCNHIHVEWIP